MDKVKELETKLEEIVAKYDSLDEVGFDELNATWKEIDEVKNEANRIAENLLVGITRQENGKFKSKAEIEFDINEIAKLTSSLAQLTDRAYDEISEVNKVERSKKELFFEKGKRRNEVRQSMRTNNSMVASLEAEIKSIKTQLGDPGLTEEMIADLASRGIQFTPSPSSLSPEKRYYLENELKAKEASLQSFKDANEMYKIEEERLTTEMGILKNGGKLAEPNIDETLDEPKLDPKEPEEEREVEPVPFPTPINPGDGEPEPGQEPEPIPFPTPINPGDGEPEPGQEPEPLPFPGDGEGLPEPEEEEHIPVEPEPKDEDEREYEATPAPLPLWKKVTLGLMTAATVFLGAIGVHTGIMAHNQNSMADSLEKIAMVDANDNQDNEPDNEPDEEEDKSKDNTPSTGDKDVNPGSPKDDEDKDKDKDQGPEENKPGENKPEEDKPTGPTEPDKPTEPTNPDKPTEPDKPSEPTNPDKPSEPTDPEPGQSDYEKENGLPAHLDEGEVIYDESTGISVNDKGVTYQENKDGSLSHLGDQDLDKSPSGSSIVGEDELNPSIPLYPPVTGEEKTAEEANLTQGEIDALQDALNGVSGEDALDEDVSNQLSEPATSEDYTHAADQAELNMQTDEEITNYFADHGIFDALNDGKALMR